MLRKILSEDLNRFRYFQGLSPENMKFYKFFISCFHTRFFPTVLYRLACALQRKKLGLLARLCSSLNFLIFGIEISVRCEIGPGLIFPHTMGTVIGAHKIGKNALIYHGVTIGAKEMDMGYNLDKRPIIGDNVTIGSGAKVLGGITIGNNVIIGANSVVIASIPDNVMVGGIPAKIINTSKKII